MASGHLLAVYLLCCVKVPVRFDKSLHFDAMPCSRPSIVTSTQREPSRAACVVFSVDT